LVIDRYLNKLYTLILALNLGLSGKAITKYEVLMRSKETVPRYLYATDWSCDFVCTWSDRIRHHQVWRSKNKWVELVIVCVVHVPRYPIIVIFTRRISE